MNPSQLTELMHAVLDGEATAAETRALERQLASNPAARAEFAALRDIFGKLEALPQAYPPEGFAAAVMTELPAYQLSAPSRVIGTTSDAASHTNTVRRSSRSWPFQGSDSMSEQSGSKRKVWIGAGLLALAGIIVASSGIDFPPGGTSTSGAIVPAQRYRADQPATTGVGQGGQADTQRSAQPVAGAASDARAADGVRADGRTGDALKMDGRTGDALKMDARSGDAMKMDARSGDAMKMDARTGDAMKNDARSGDARRSDGRAADSLKANGRVSDSRANDGRKAGEGQKDFLP